MNKEIIISEPRKWNGKVKSFQIMTVPAGKDNEGTKYVEISYHDSAISPILAFGEKLKKLNIFGNDPKEGVPAAVCKQLQDLLDANKPFPVEVIQLESYEVSNLPRYAHKYSISKKFVNGTEIVKGEIVKDENGIPRWETSMNVTCINCDALGIHETPRSVVSRILHNKELVALDNANAQAPIAAPVNASAEGAEPAEETPAASVEVEVETPPAPVAK